jgi:diaminopimelate epimerase
MRRGLIDRSVTVTLPGGPLRIDWREDGEIVMTGAAAESFRGTFESVDYGAAG